MLMLIFKAGKNRFALDAKQVREVIPKIALKPITVAPPYVPGFANFGRIALPIVDFTLLLENQPSRNCLHTRVILLKTPHEENEPAKYGLMVEGLTKTTYKESEEFVNTGIMLRQFPFLVWGWTDPDGIIQIVDIDKLNLYLKDQLSNIK